MTSRTTLLAIVAVVCTYSLPLFSHDLTSGVGTQSFVSFTKEEMRIKLNFGVARNRGQIHLEAMDTDHDGRVSQEERDAWMKTQGESLAALIEVHANGRALEFEVVEHVAIGVIGRVMHVEFDTFFELVAKLPGQIDGGGWWIHIQDRTCQDVESSQFICPLIIDSADPSLISYIIFEPGDDKYVEEFEWFKIPGRNAVLFVNNDLRWLPGQIAVPSIESLVERVLDGDAVIATRDADPNSADTELQPKQPQRKLEQKGPVSAKGDTPFFTPTHVWVGILVVVVGAYLSFSLWRKP